MFSPGVCKINDEDKLNQDEEEGAGEAKVHPGRSEWSVGNEEWSDRSEKQDQDFETPKSVLEVWPRITWALKFSEKVKLIDRMQNVYNIR